MVAPSVKRIEKRILNKAFPGFFDSFIQLGIAILFAVTESAALPAEAGMAELSGALAVTLPQ
jgi:hypothetical protein